MKKWYEGIEAAEMLTKATRKWTETGDYGEGQRGPCGELGWTHTYVEIGGTVYRLTYGREGFPSLDKR